MYGIDANATEYGAYTLRAEKEKSIRVEYAETRIYDLKMWCVF